MTLELSLEVCVQTFAHRVCWFGADPFSMPFLTNSWFLIGGDVVEMTNYNEDMIFKSAAVIRYLIDDLPPFVSCRQPGLNLCLNTPTIDEHAATPNFTHDGLQVRHQ